MSLTSTSEPTKPGMPYRPLDDGTLRNPFSNPELGAALRRQREWGKPMIEPDPAKVALLELGCLLADLIGRGIPFELRTANTLTRDKFRTKSDFWRIEIDGQHYIRRKSPKDFADNIKKVMSDRGDRFFANAIGLQDGGDQGLAV